jgi:asparagine synthase (glutamine-hydrolysing)
LSAIYDEPFADSSQIPTHLVCKAARQQITVALSGDAGDELFGGYNRYFWAPRIWKKLAWLPYPARQALGKTITTIPIAAWDGLGHMLNDVRTGEKLHKLGRAINRVRNLDGLYSNLLSEWLDPAGVVKGCETQLFAADLSIHSPPVINFVERMMYHDSMTYLPNDILCKVDRAAMATGLETRMPFLDHRLAELSWKLPLHMKIRGNEGKWALRQVLYELVPRELIDRPKVGFSVPVGEWLRGPLRNWAESLLDERRLQTEGYFYSGPIRKKWTEHLVGHRDHTASLWAVLMFQAWLEKNV